MKKFFVVLFTLFVGTGQAQLLDENFDYGVSNTDLPTASSSVWSNHDGGTGSTDVQYTTSGLSYSGYANSGIGGAASLSNSNSRTGDDNRTFTGQSSGSVYLSALVSVTSITSGVGGEYFLHFGTSAGQYCKLYGKDNGGNLNFGIKKYSEPNATYSATHFTFSTTYLIIIKYTFNGSPQDDRVDLWVLSSGVPGSEEAAGTPTIENVTAANNDASSLSAVSLRQGTNSHSVTVDGIRVATSWSQAPLPVELTSFTALVNKSSVNLNWQTATEKDNYGFEIDRRIDNGQLKIDNWESIGFVNGHGNSNSPKEYSFVDKKVSASGKYFYRLKQIDTDGSFEYSEAVEVDFGYPNNFELMQNYPNPFNPKTKIKFTIPSVETGHTSTFRHTQGGASLSNHAPSLQVLLKVYDILGNEVATLVNEEKDPGIYEVEYNPIDVPAGIYFYELRSGDFRATKKLVLLK